VRWAGNNPMPGRKVLSVATMSKKATYDELQEQVVRLKDLRGQLEREVSTLKEALVQQTPDKNRYRDQRLSHETGYFGKTCPYSQGGP